MSSGGCQEYVPGAEELSVALSSQEGNVRTLWPNPGLANGAMDAGLVMLLEYLVQSVGCRLEPLSVHEMQPGQVQSGLEDDLCYM